MPVKFVAKNPPKTFTLRLGKETHVHQFLDSNPVELDDSDLACITHLDLSRDFERVD